MRCRTARRRILDATLSGVRESAPASCRALDEHLSRCRSCAEEARESWRLAADLGRLRLEIPFALDVSESVMDRIARSGGRTRPEVPRVWVRAIFGAAAAAAAAIAWLMIGSAPVLGAQLGRAWTLVQGIAGALSEIVRPLLHFADAAGTLAQHASAAASPLLARVARSAPSYSTSAVCATAAMVAVTTLAVRRDLRRSAPPRNPKEPEP